MENFLAADRRGGDGKGAPWRRGFSRRREIGFLQLGQHAPAGGGIAFARFGEAQYPRRAMEQLGPDMIFEKGDGAADRGRRFAQAAPRPGQTAFFEGGDEYLHRVDDRKSVV